MWGVAVGGGRIETFAGQGGGGVEDDRAGCSEPLLQPAGVDERRVGGQAAAAPLVA